MSPPTTLLVTGATGFVGRHLLPFLQDRGYAVRPVGREQIGSICETTDWRPFLNGVDAVIHLAGRAHVMRETEINQLDIYRKVNRDGTIALARQAREAGVGRFVFMSSVKVMGECSGRPLTMQDQPAPCDPYGVSKAEAEEALTNVCGPMQVVSLRPPLVYGPHVKGNFLTLLKIVEKGWPLPLGAVRNRRSMIYIGNLAAAIEAALTCAPGHYLPSDGVDLSTADLIRAIGAAMNKQPKLIPVPVPLLHLAGLMTGKSAMVQRLSESLTVDGHIPGWKPPFSINEGLSDTVQWFNQPRT